MAIPHTIQLQLIKKRLIGKDGKAKLEEHLVLDFELAVQ